MKKVREIRSRVASDFLLWQKPLSRLPRGGDAQASSNKTLTWKINKAINRPAPFPFGKGGGIGQAVVPIITFIWVRSQHFDQSSELGRSLLRCKHRIGGMPSKTVLRKFCQFGSFCTSQTHTTKRNL